MPRYRARGVILDDRPYVKITEPTAHGEFLVGYFDHVHEITDHGVPVDLAEIEITEDDDDEDGGA